MLNKYPEIWLRESVMLVDLQTSFIFSPSPPFSLPFLSPSCPPLSLPALCQPTKGPQYKRRDTSLRHSTQLLLISLHSEEKNALTCTLTHTQTQRHTHTYIHLSRYRKSCGVSDGYLFAADL